MQKNELFHKIKVIVYSLLRTIFKKMLKLQETIMGQNIFL